MRYKIYSKTYRNMKPRYVKAKSYYDAKLKVQLNSGGNLVATFLTAEKMKRMKRK